MYAFRLIIKDREYKGWEWEPKCIEEEDKEKDDTINTIALDPGLHKLFHNDIVDQGGSIIKKSPYRDEEIIHGILITTGKTYGRLKDSKLLYQCIPDDKTLPHFLVPFEEKNIGFHKNKKDNNNNNNNNQIIIKRILTCPFQLFTTAIKISAVVGSNKK